MIIRGSEEVSAFIILKDGQELAPEDVRDFCRGKKKPVLQSYSGIIGGGFD